MPKKNLTWFMDDPYEEEEKEKTVWPLRLSTFDNGILNLVACKRLAEIWFRLGKKAVIWNLLCSYLVVLEI